VTSDNIHTKQSYFILKSNIAQNRKTNLVRTKAFQK